MPKQGLSLRMIKDVIRLKHAQLSHAQIATTLRISKGVVTKYLTPSDATGLSWEAVQDWNELQLATALRSLMEPRNIRSSLSKREKIRR